MGPSPPWLIQTFEEVFPGPPAVARKMFGYPAAFVNGNMFSGLFQDQLILRLPEESRKELLAVPGAKPFEPMPGRAMREYVVAPPALFEDRKRLSSWVGKALAYGASLPPKSSSAKGNRKPPANARAKPAKRPRN